MRLPIAEPYVAVPIDLQVGEVVVVERLPRYIPSNVWSWVSVKSVQFSVIAET